MKIDTCRLGACAALLLGALVGSARAQVAVTTYHNDNARTGQYTQETLLTPANVNSTQFGKLFTTAVDGSIYAQPLYLSNVSIGGSTHNVLYVATQNDTLYAIDADSGTIYWHLSLIPASGAPITSGNIGHTGDDLGGCTDIVPEIGITGTPVIDANTGTIYVVAISRIGTGYFQYLHAIDVSTAAEKFGGPVSITATGFLPLNENQRAALLLENNHVVIGWSSHCDGLAWHGWVMSYSAGSLTQEGVYNTTANGNNAGVWMSGGGLAADAGGNIYFATGNGDWDGSSNFGDSIIKLGPPSGGSFPLVDYFTPWNQSTLAANDEDLASGGVVLLPPLPSGKQLLAHMAKEGEIYLVDTGKMGKYCVTQGTCSATPPSTNPNIPQDLPNASVGVWGSPAYWNGSVYWGPGRWGGQTDTIKAFSFNAGGSGLLSTTPTSTTTNGFGFTAPTPAISANGTTAGILWGIDNSTYNAACSGGSNCQILYAYDATNLATMLYNSSQAPSLRDVPGGGAVKFTTPIIANGKVYFGGQSAVSGFGLLGGVPVTATVMLNPVPGSYTTAQSVKLSDTTAGAVIYYTLDGTRPTAKSAVYSTALPVSATTTITAIAIAPGDSASPPTGGVYTIAASSTSSSVSLAAAANVDAIGANGSAVVGGGIDGSGYAYSATLLGSSLSWSGISFTLGGAGALDAVSNTTITLPAGNFSNLYMLATGVDGNQPNQTFIVTYTDGTTTSFTQSLSDWFTPQNYSGESKAATEAYRLSASGANDNRTFYLYGYNFALNSAKTVKSLTLPNNRNVVVLAVTLQTAGAVTPVTANVGFNPAPGSFTTPQSVMLSDTTPNAVIYYALNGAPLTTGSAVYGGTALQVSATTTINAFAVAPGDTASPSTGGTYTIAAASPTSNVNLAPSANVDAIGANGGASVSGGIDGGGYTYSSTLLGSALSWSGVSFTLGTAGALDAVSNTTLTLPAGNFTNLYVLATGVNGNQPNQSFVLTYTDGSTATYTQSLSDWYTPQSYSGESKVATEAYRLSASGATDSRTFYVYGYNFALNSAKTVKSLALPNNRNVVVLAATLQSTAPVTPVTATVMLNPAPGSFTTPQSVMLSDTTPNAVIYYALNGAPLTTGSAVYGGTALQVSATTTINAFAVAPGDSPSASTGGTYTIGAASPITSVNLTSAANLDGIGNNGSAVTGGGIDGTGSAYSSTLLGTSLSWSGVNFTFSPVGALNAVHNATVALPAGDFSKLYMLATGVNGNQANQTFIVTYTDGTTTTVTQSLSDWFTPQTYTGESKAATEAYRLSASGATDNRTFYLYGYTLAINSAKTVQSLALPKNNNVVVLALTLTP